jgi:hypothetical protein
MLATIDLTKRLNLRNGHWWRSADSPGRDGIHCCNEAHSKAFRLGKIQTMVLTG